MEKLLSKRAKPEPNQRLQGLRARKQTQVL